MRTGPTRCARARAPHVGRLLDQATVGGVEHLHELAQGHLLGGGAPVFLVAEAALLWRIGSRFGFDRRAAILVAVPVLGLFVHVAFAWRLGHHRTRTWKTLEPSWGRHVWTVLTVVGILIWTWTVARIVLA